MGSAAPTTALWLSPAWRVSVAGEPARAVAMKVTGGAEPLVTVACTFWAPAVVPIVQVTWACPFAPVVSLGALTLPPPYETTKSTIRFWMGLPRPSLTCATSALGSCPPTESIWPSPDTLTSCKGTCATVAVTCALAPPTVAVICALPFPAANTTPTLGADEVTVATVVLLDAHPTVAVVIVSPRWSRTVALSGCVTPRDPRFTEDGLIRTVVGSGTSGSVPLHPTAKSARSARRRPQAMGTSIRKRGGPKVNSGAAVRQDHSRTDR